MADIQISFTTSLEFSVPSELHPKSCDYSQTSNMAQIDSSSWKAYGKIDPELEALIPHMPPSKGLGDYEDVPSLRVGIMEQIGQLIAAGIFPLPDLSGIHKEEIQIPVRDGSSIRGLLYYAEDRPAGETGPVLVYFHGGGWVFGPPEAFEGNLQLAAKELGLVVISVDYRLAPEHPFPTPAHDAWDSVQWIAANAGKFGGDPTKGFIVSGESAGGNLAAIVAHEAADADLSPPITGALLNVPSVVHPEAVPEELKPHYNSYEEFKDALVLPRKALDFLFGNYKPNPQDPRFSVLNWPSGHKKQPPTYVQVCGMDPLRDEGLIYEQTLKQLGVPTQLKVWQGLPHAAPSFFPMLSASKTVPEETKDELKWLLAQKS
ncbi:Alpha/Beta hydrolase protein [Lophiotrema nucula]|uniref:Alpha/Beta hydrolase protein n=1 Tax=Lophiotrema nucula TaxID=690887 RepID=A0A6A5Z129_9PLEO|nr:Alpha/Beta hydrolase protein [Lophiotrema nucula]